MKELERTLKALANARRLAIVKYVKRARKASVSDIAEEIHLSFKATSRHLAVLTGAGVLEKEQEGLVVWHALTARKHPIVLRVLELL